MADFPNSRNLQKIKKFSGRLFTMEGLNDPVLKRRMLYIALLFFIGGLFLSIRAQPSVLSDIIYMPMLLVIFCVLAGLGASALEFLWMAALYGKKLSFIQALETIVIGIAANMMPLPGNIMFKISRLKSLGIDYKKGLGVTLAMVPLGLSLVMLYAGACLIWMDAALSGAALIAAGAGGLVTVFIYFQCIYKNLPLFFKLLAVRGVQILLLALRLYLCLLALGITGTFAQASVLTVANILGSLIAIIPAGLGIQEIFAAIIGPFIGLTAAAAFLASTLNRLLGMVTVLPLSGLLALHLKKEIKE